MNRTLIKNADILTMDAGLGELRADVLIEGDRIAAIGADLPVRDAEIIDATGMILMPGMIDGHRHVWEIIDMGRLVKSRPSEYARYYQQWKMRTIVCMTPEDNYLAELIGGLQAIDSGVTTVFDFAHGQPTEACAMSAAQGLKDSGIAGWFGFQLGVSSSYKAGDTVSLAKADAERIARTTESHWATAERLQRELFSDSAATLQLALAPSGNAGSALEDIRSEWTRARGMGVGMLAAHIHKPERPYPAGVMGHRDSGIRDLYEAGLLGPDYQATHANRLTPDELAMLRDTGGMICATAMGEFPYVMSESKGPSVHGRSRSAGVPTSMGIDISLALPGDYFEHVRATYWNLYLDPECREQMRACTSEYILDFATAYGAQALRLGDTIGSIRVGKRADLVLLSTERVGFGMAGSLADRVVTFASTADVDSVWIAGKARKRHGKMLGVDWRALKAQLVEAQQRIGRQAATIRFT
ncbi:amidohydrolase family protein [Cupriavidus oxalaticus]|uniref:Amidohydrolase family protein n=1 Tax=Cupriavidus oxalaticus TaxID=96344 RepID=A0A375GPN1_9BURK|nr:amidohydrolase family protein [Cupriavidus oxalaticus]QRQ85120.1 amidohydrolase family protein [Cupriavidus oxalaticus]QRQ90792.1 amidohydrolase family protein [Cupriavidus oxalaticus]WQD85318.1 amidohydrolase family protein [Cupriavidus oxalaticus]SPC23306.1 Amidohydrolase family protein 16 [Cupriavidus oxalaticus]